MQPNPEPTPWAMAEVDQLRAQASQGLDDLIGHVITGLKAGNDSSVCYSWIVRQAWDHPEGVPHVAAEAILRLTRQAEDRRRGLSFDGTMPLGEALDMLVSAVRDHKTMPQPCVFGESCIGAGASEVIDKLTREQLDGLLHLALIRLSRAEETP